MKTLRLLSRAPARWFAPALAGLALAGAVTFSSGCFVVAAGVVGGGSVAYVEGKLTTTLPRPLGAVAQATNQALGQMQFPKISEEQDALSDTIVARTAQDKKITIELRRQGSAATKVQIRIGTFGDRDASQLILDRIKSDLPPG